MLDRLADLFLYASVPLAAVAGAWVARRASNSVPSTDAEQRLARTMATLQSVLDSATAVGVMTLTTEQRISLFNKGAENLLGFSAQELMDSPALGRFFDAAELGALRETLELIWGREPTPAEVLDHVMAIRQEQEWTLVRKDARRFKANLIFSPLLDAQGVAMGHVAMVYDISKQKEYELSLREAKQLAEQSSVAKSQFLANMSHEIRTPMNAILGMLQLLRNTSLQANQRDYAEKAAGAARSLLGLLNDILDFSKVEAGKMQLNPEPFVLEELLGEVAVILSSNLGAKDVDLVFDMDPAIPHELVGDSMRLKQILINLGGNAVKFTSQGQVLIRCKLLSRAPERAKLLLEVEDTGIGIAPENQGRIFEGFTQAESNTTRRFGGTGLGLVISTRLIRLMGGELQLRSALGQGSTFSFMLDMPVVDISQAALLAPKEPTPTGTRVMLVDDNPVARACGAAMMRAMGWDVVEVASGSDALASLGESLYRANPPLHAVFVDAHMPDMDGWDTLRGVRRLYGGHKPPALILLSRQSRDALGARSGLDQSLTDGLVLKPFTGAMLSQALELAAGAQHGAPERLTMHAKPLQDMRVLLVEDNPINRQVAQELLSAEGAQVTLAENGAVGIEALQKQGNGFDAVLMDLQMPVLDGLAATRLLRQDARFTKLPIIAMTANAMESDREECLQAGMNDHVGKPFDIHQLVQTLQRLTGWARLSDAGRGTFPHDPERAGQQWPASVDVNAALARMGGNKPLLLRSISAFIEDAAALPPQLAQWTLLADWATMRRELHAFKGLSATVGLRALATAAAQAEAQLPASGPLPGYQAAEQVLVAAIERALPDLQLVAGGLRSPETESPLNHPVAPSLDEASTQQLHALLQALQGADMFALELHARWKMEAPDFSTQTSQALDAAMADLDFEAAALHCAELMQQSGQQFIGANA